MLVLLDLDGTLTDPYVGIAGSVVHALRRLELPAPDRAVLRSFLGPPLQDRFAQLGLDAAQVQQAVTAYRERYSERGLYENRLYDGVPDVLAELRSAGHRLAVATSKPTVFAARVVEHFGIAAHFDLVAGATLDGARRRKDDVIGFALRRLGSPPQDAVMVGDRAQDVHGARAHGVRSIGVTWGYADAGELQAAAPDALIDRPAELPGALGG